MSRLALFVGNVQALTIRPRKRRSAATRTDASADGSGASRVPNYDVALFVYHDGRWFSYDHVDVCDYCMHLYDAHLDPPHTCPS